jgi:adenylate kinase family enzyme
MRPRSLAEFAGQKHAVGPGTPLRLEIERDSLSSLILFGPPGCGKTSLARVIAETTQAYFEEMSAVNSGVKDVRGAIESARQRLGMDQRRTILFIDEIHRFNRSQQDALLHAVEDGLVILIGATTENPFFEVNAPLISRSRIVELTPLSDEEVAGTMRGAQRFIDPAIYDEGMPRLLERIRTRKTQPVEVQVLRCGDVCVVGIPAEYFVEFGLRIKEAVWPCRALVASHTNGMIGYVPTAKAFERGGYETTFGLTSRMAPEAGDLMADAAIGQIQSHPALRTNG